VSLDYDVWMCLTSFRQVRWSAS